MDENQAEEVVEVLKETVDGLPKMAGKDFIKAGVIVFAIGFGGTLAFELVIKPICRQTKSFLERRKDEKAAKKAASTEDYGTDRVEE